MYSQAVTHPSTNMAQYCLTAVIGRELVFSTWYGRIQEQEDKLYLLEFPKIFEIDKKMNTAPHIPRRSPIQVLTRPNVA